MEKPWHPFLGSTERLRDTFPPPQPQRPSRARFFHPQIFWLSRSPPGGTPVSPLSPSLQNGGCHSRGEGLEPRPCSGVHGVRDGFGAPLPSVVLSTSTSASIRPLHLLTSGKPKLFRVSGCQFVNLLGFIYSSVINKDGNVTAGTRYCPRVTVVVLPQLPCATRLRHRHQPQFILGRVRGRVTKRNPHPQPPTMGTTPEKTRDAGEGLGAGAVAVTSCSLSPLAGSHGSKRGAWTHGGARTEGKGGEHHPRAPICPLLQRAGSWPGWGHPSAVEGTHGCRSGVMEWGSTRARGRDAGGGDLAVVTAAAGGLAGWARPSNLPFCPCRASPDSQGHRGSP